MVNLKKAQMANARCGKPNVVRSRAGFLAEFTIFDALHIKKSQVIKDNMLILF